MATPTAIPSAAGMPPPYQRHALGLPAGSVRAILGLMVFGLFWALLLLPEASPQPVPLYLYYLMFLILGHYFAARGHGGSVPGRHEPPPLYLPRGSLRALFLLGFVGALGWGYYNDPNFLDRLTPTIKEQTLLPLILLGSFFLGIVVARFGQHVLAGPEGLPPWFQDIQAWIALLAVLGLGVEVIIRLVINPKLEQGLQLPQWESILAGLVSFYFGARS